VTVGCAGIKANLLQLFDFLSRFPIRNAIVETLISDETSLDSLFPPGKFFQAKYAAQALRMKLRDQLHSVSAFSRPFGLLCTDNDQSTFDDEFLANSIQLLDKALLNPDLIKSRASTSQGVQLAVVLIDVLLQFLRGKSPRTTWPSCQCLTCIRASFAWHLCKIFLKCEPSYRSPCGDDIDSTRSEQRYCCGSNLL
jgi:hypothetical protein